jgi:hypothetical protein
MITTTTAPVENIIESGIKHHKPNKFKTISFPNKKRKSFVSVINQILFSQISFF